MTAQTVTLTVDGAKQTAFANEPLIHVLVRRAPAWRSSPKANAPRSMFCGMGLCFECMVEVDGRPVRACLVAAHEGMNITTASPPAKPASDGETS